MKYKTKAGQMWDEIAYEVYGDCRYVTKLFEANPQHLEYFVTPDGLELQVPEIEAESKNNNLPGWRL